MILKSKLSQTAFSMADPDKWVKGDKDGIDPVVLGRLAYAGQANNKVIVITDGGGYRSYAEQVDMYKRYLAGKLQATAAVPGTSWHGSRLAVDTSTYPIRGMTSAQLAKYGLCKPLKNEGWHIQPIETINMGAKCNTSLEPEEMEEEEMAEKVYQTLNDVPDWGKEAVQKVIKNKGITPTENSTATIDDDDINLTHSMLRIYVSLNKMGML